MRLRYILRGIWDKIGHSEILDFEPEPSAHLEILAPDQGERWVQALPNVRNLDRKNPPKK